MPAGVSWSRYISFLAAATLTMFVGAQTVHIYYEPLSDLDTYIEEELKRK
ncbi:ubiquinol-cytochrome c reductase complex assembly factor 6 [Tenebrio molitor]|jgi:hypothetical protein